MGVADEATIKAGQRLEALGEYGAKVYGAIQEKERLAQDNLDAMTYKNNLIDERDRVLKDFAADEDHEGFDNKLKNELEKIRQKIEPANPSVRLKLATEATFNHYSEQIKNAVIARKHTVMDYKGKVEAIRLGDNAVKDYANAFDDTERKAISDKFGAEMDVLKSSFLIDPYWVETHKLSWEGKAKQYAIDLADVTADKLIEANPKQASIDLRDSKVIPNLLPKQRRDKVEKAIAASKIFDAEQEKKAKEAEKLAHDKEERELGNLFLQGNYKDAYLFAQKSNLLSGDEKRIWGNSIELKAKEKVEQIDPVVEAAEIVRTNDMITRDTLPPSAIRNHIITTPGLGKENKEQYINKLETKLGKEIEDGRREGYGDIKNIIFPPAKGLSIESLIQTPQQTYAIMAAQMALDSWINTEVKANRSPLKNEIRRKAQQLAQDYQVKFKDKIQYLEKEMEQLNLK